MPDPLPLIDEIILFLAFMLLGGILLLRDFISAVGDMLSTVTNPVVLAFVFTLAGLFIITKFLPKERKNKTKRLPRKTQRKKKVRING